MGGARHEWLFRLRFAQGSGSARFVQIQRGKAEDMETQLAFLAAAKFELDGGAPITPVSILVREVGNPLETELEIAQRLQVGEAKVEMIFAALVFLAVRLFKVRNQRRFQVVAALQLSYHGIGLDLNPRSEPHAGPVRSR